MNRLLVLSTVFAALACGAELSAVRTVYVMPMARGIDQFLANRVAASGTFHVVADPKLADAIFTDRIGGAFRIALEEVAPSPKPPENAEEGAKKKDEEKADNPAVNSTFGRGKGTYFLVDAKSREVVWSTFQMTVSSAAKELDKTAVEIVSRLKRDLNPPKK